MKAFPHITVLAKKCPKRPKSAFQSGVYLLFFLFFLFFQLPFLAALLALLLPFFPTLFAFGFSLVFVGFVAAFAAELVAVGLDGIGEGDGAVGFECQRLHKGVAQHVRQRLPHVHLGFLQRARHRNHRGELILGLVLPPARPALPTPNAPGS